MTAIQLKAEVMHNINVVAEDENMLNRVAKYLRKLAAEKQTDSTEMTKGGFFC